METTTRYAIVDLGTLGGPGKQAPLAINEHGVIAGRASTVGGTHAFRRLTQLDDLTPGLTGVTSEAKGLNDLSNEQIVGHVGYSAMLWSEGNATDLSAILEAPFSFAADVNGSDQVVGASGPVSVQKRAFRLDLQTHHHETLVLPGHNFSTAAAINDHGVAVGNSGRLAGFDVEEYIAFAYDGAMTKIQTPGARVHPLDVNNDGVVVGWMQFEHQGYPPAGFLFDSTEVEPIFPPPFPTEGSIAQGINNSGMIVGSNQSTSGSNAWVRMPDGDPLDLNDLLLGRSRGWHLDSARAVNDKGQIVGGGRLFGQERMFLLDPVVLPSEMTTELVVDPLALALGDAIYAQLKLPDPPPFEQLEDSVRAFLQALPPSQREGVAHRVRAFRDYFVGLDDELTRLD